MSDIRTVTMTAWEAFENSYLEDDNVASYNGSFVRSITLMSRSGEIEILCDDGGCLLGPDDPITLEVDISRLRGLSWFIILVKNLEDPEVGGWFAYKEIADPAILRGWGKTRWEAVACLAAVMAGNEGETWQKTETHGLVGLVSPCWSSKERTITQKEWESKQRHGYAHYIPYILTMESGATVLVPVRIVPDDESQGETQPKENDSGLV